jgi:TfdA family taurine catabolism dioxygenase TauD
MPDDIAFHDMPTRAPAEPMKPVIDPADWTGRDLEASDDWKFVLTGAEIAEIDAAVAGVEARGIEIKDITRQDFPLPTLDAKLAALRDQLLDGRGLAMLQGMPVERYDINQAAIAYWGVALRIGEQVSQNYKGHLLGHVYDLVGPDRDKNPSVRAYHTSAELAYHSDSCDVVVLMCLRQAKSGGGNRLASTVAIHNEMLRRRPDLVAELIKPWYRDRRNEIPPGKDPWFQLPVFHFADGYFSAGWQNFYIRTAQRFEDLPRFTEAQIAALDMMDILAEELSISLTTRPGDILFLHNHVVVHARNGYEDWPEPDRMRHLLRFWLATPGGRPLTDALLDRYVGLKPGQRPAGIIVEGMEFHTPLIPE